MILYLSIPNNILTANNNNYHLFQVKEDFKINVETRVFPNAYTRMEEVINCCPP